MPVHLTKLGILKDGKPNRDYFEENLKQSRRAVEFGKAEMAREMIDEAQEFLSEH